MYPGELFEAEGSAKAGAAGKATPGGRRTGPAPLLFLLWLSLMIRLNLTVVDTLMTSIFQVPGQQVSPARKKRRSTGRSGDGLASSPSNDSDNSVPGIKRDKLYCICKQKYDATKFYVGCDICSNWFHGSCVNITPRMSKKMSE